jgi:hypothetical protein
LFFISGFEPRLLPLVESQQCLFAGAAVNGFFTPRHK